MQSNKFRVLGPVVLLALLHVGVASADTCMVAPTDKKTVAGRFGKFRPGGAGNHGSAQKAPHTHNGLDFSTSGMSKPLYAASEGTVSYVGNSATAGLMVYIKRPTGDVLQYMHMDSIDPKIKNGVTVQAGQQIGMSGNTPATSMAKHLHLSYGTAQKDSARFKQFSTNSESGPFKPGQLPTIFKSNALLGYITDPSPYFCDTFPIQDGNPADVPKLGADTKAQHAILFGSVPSGGVAPQTGATPTQVAAANMDAIAAQSSGKEVKDWVSNDVQFGALPEPPIGGYEHLSAVEMLRTEAMRRFADPTWSTELTKVDARALLVDFARAAAVSNYMTEAIYRKRERVEALIAVLAARRANATFERHLSAMHERAALDKMSRAIR